MIRVVEAMQSGSHDTLISIDPFTLLSLIRATTESYIKSDEAGQAHSNPNVARILIEDGRVFFKLAETLQTILDQRNAARDLWNADPANR